jgi:hypothetical protein
MLNQEDEALAERRLERLIARLPRRLAAFLRWVRAPQRFWVRVPIGILLIFGGFLAILPVFGLWMTPLGVILLAQDFGPVRRAVYQVVNWTARRRPQWFAES